MSRNLKADAAKSLAGATARSAAPRLLAIGVLGCSLTACVADRVVTGSAVLPDYHHRHPIVLAGEFEHGGSDRLRRLPKQATAATIRCARCRAR